MPALALSGFSEEGLNQAPDRDQGPGLTRGGSPAQRCGCCTIVGPHDAALVKLIATEWLDPVQLFFSSSMMAGLAVRACWLEMQRKCPCEVGRKFLRGPPQFCRDASSNWLESEQVMLRDFIISLMESHGYLICLFKNPHLGPIH